MNYNIFLVIVLCISSVLMAGCMDMVGTTPKEKTVDMCHFSLHDPSSNSSVKGAMFAKMDDSGRHVIISAFVDIKPEDVGGVGFYIPDGWEIVERTSSYPDGNMSAYPERCIETHEYSGGTNKRIFVGFVYGPDRFCKGGNGVIIIRLEPEDRRNPPDIFKIMIGVGSEKGYITHPVIDNFSLIFPENQE